MSRLPPWLHFAFVLLLPAASGLSGEVDEKKVRTDSINSALNWLARNQCADGHWDAKKHESTMKTDAGVTGLALLAFLEAGHTQQKGKWKDNVRRATVWIIKKQAASGAIGKGYEGTEPGGVHYHHAICGLALSRAYGLTGGKRLLVAASKALAYSTNVHQMRGSGWRYAPGQVGGADLSVTGWFFEQLVASKQAGLRVPARAWGGTRTFLDSVSDRQGRCRYRPDWLRPNPAMTAVGVFIRMHCGADKRDARVQGGRAYVMKHLPVWGQRGVGVNMYYWYYGTRAMLQIGGKDWPKWGNALSVLPAKQRKGGRLGGSWDPAGCWATRGGRVYSTAMGVLCLTPTVSKRGRAMMPAKKTPGPPPYWARISCEFTGEE